jgi:hypothetical protein
VKEMEKNPDEEGGGYAPVSSKIYEEGTGGYAPVSSVAVTNGNVVETFSYKH